MSESTNEWCWKITVKYKVISGSKTVEHWLEGRNACLGTIEDVMDDFFLTRGVGRDEVESITVTRAPFMDRL